MAWSQKKRSLLFKTMFYAILIVGIVFSTFGQQASAAERYSDVHPTNTHYQNIMDAAEMGMMGGYPDGTFKPYMKLPRANVVKALGKYVIKTNDTSLAEFDVSGVEAFADVPATYPDKELYQYSLVVKKTGIFVGSNNKLMPTNLISREQMAKVLVHAFELEHVQGATSKVTDNDKAQPEFREYIDILSENNVTNVEKYRPRESTTRDQFATFLMRSYRALLEKDNPADPVDPTEPEDPVVPADPVEPDPAVPADPEFPEVPEEPEAPPATPLFVEEFLPISGQFILLPQKAKVTYDDGTIKDHPVTWNDENVDWKVPGTYDLTGQVEDTNLEAKITVDFYFLPIFIPDLIMILQGPEVTKASNLISKLPEEIKKADNSISAAGKWRLANDAVKAVNKKFPEYDISSWQTVLDKEWKVIEKWQVDINNARAVAQAAISNLLGYKRSNYPNIVEEQRAEITEAKSIVQNYEKLDKKANTTKMHESIAKHEKRVNDLEVALGYLDKMTLRLENKGSEFVKAFRESPTIKHSSVHVSWRHMYQTDIKVKNFSEYWELERRYLVTPFTSLYADFTVQVVNGDAVVSKDFRVQVPEGKFIGANPAAYVESLNRPVYSLKMHQSN